MAVTLGDVRGRLSTAVGRVHRPLGAWTLQEQAGDAFEPVQSSKVEERWNICMVELRCGQFASFD